MCESIVVEQIKVTFIVEPEHFDNEDESGLTEEAWTIVHEAIAQVGTDIDIVLDTTPRKATS
jgi:hypothetical protein